MEKRNYQNGKIYCIRNSFDDDVYVGSTTQSLSKRMEKHRSIMFDDIRGKCMFYQKMRDLGTENFYIELLQKYPCDDIEELRAKEGEWIRKMGTLNMKVAGRTTEQYRKDTVEHKREYDEKYRKDNEEKIRERQQRKYQNSKDKIKERSANRYAEKKDEIRAKMNTKCQCDCGVIYSYGNRLRHFNSKFHQNYLNNNIENVSKEKTDHNELSPTNEQTSNWK